MNRPLILALAALSLLPAEAALAGSSSCGGGGSDSGGGGGSSGGGSSGGGSSDDYSSSDSGGESSSSEPACVDSTDIVGYRRCRRFGGWRGRLRAPIVVEMGLASRTFASPLREAGGSFSHDDESFTYRVVGRPPEPSPEPGMDAATVFRLRAGVGLGRGLYLAGEVEAGGLTRTAGRAEMTSTGVRGAPTITADGGILLGAAGVVGVAGGLGPISLGVEAAGGTRALIYYYESRYLACTSYLTHEVNQAFLEARARAQLWASPFFHLGVSAGANVVDRGGWTAGVHLGFASKAYANHRD
ncbi:MAG TPA: hypothetical protein VK932_13300 [Kofleriaceae bacterium]|nr:hypothetical protein [Kofleriaceae bacterium]